MNITVRCTTCYPMRLGDCPDTLYFAIAVAANTEYAYELCDSQGNIYEGETTTNGSGNVSISTSDVPFDAYPGLFNKWAGSFKLTLYDADGDAVPFTVAGTEYTCIAFSFRETVELDNCNNEISCGCLTGGYAFPSDLIGQDGDFYIVETTGVILEKVDGAWTVFFVPSSGSVTGASNGLNLEGTNVEMGGALNENTTISAGAFNYKVTSVPEANKTAEYEASQDLFGLLALVGNAINGQGNRYVLTHDGNGDPESWLFQKVSNDTSVGGSYNSTIGYINLATGIECYFEVTTAGVRMVTTDGTNQTGLTVTQATEIIEAIVNGVTKMTIDSSGVTVNNLTSAGDRLVFANLNGLLGIKTSAQATAMLDNMVGDSGAGGTKGLVPAPAAGDGAANKYLKADGTWAAASGSAASVITLDAFGTLASGSSASTAICHRVTPIAANTIANNDQFTCYMEMYGDVAAGDVSYAVILSNTQIPVGAGTFFNAVVDSYLYLNIFEVFGVTTSSKICYAHMNSSNVWYMASNNNVYAPYLTGGNGAVAVGGTRQNQGTVPINWAATVYLHWFTISATAARVRGYFGGYVMLNKKL